MAKRFDFYFRQPVTESELDGAFDALEVADRAAISDLGLTGVVTGMGVTQVSPTPGISCTIGAGTAYDPQGERINLPTPQTISLATDSSNASTAVGNPGNAKVISVYLAFTRNLLDPRTDGNGATVYFERDESFTFFIRQGAEAASGSELPPALESDKLLLADIKFTFGMTQVLTAAISPYTPNRRQDSFVVNGAITTLREGLLKNFLSDFVGVFDTHKGDLSQHGAAGHLTPGTRLSVSSTLPVPTGDLATQSTIYLLPYTDSRIVLLGAADSPANRDVGAGVNLALAGLTSGKNYDVFAYWNGSAVVLELSNAWTSDTARADALATVLGFLVKSADHTRRYVGTIRASAATTTEDTKLKRFIWNHYNRVERSLGVVDTTDTWTYATTNTYRQANASATNCFEYVTGDAASVLVAETMNVALGNGAVVYIAFAGVGIDSTTVNSAAINMPGMVTATGEFGGAFAKYRGQPGLGYHKINWLEAVNNAAGKFAGDDGLTTGLLQAGMQGVLLG